MDLDELLVELWDRGFDSVNGPNDYVYVDQLRGQLDLSIAPDSRQLRSIRHWQIMLNCDRVDIERMLAEFGLSISPSAKTLPKGAIARLRQVKGRASENDRKIGATPLLSRQTREIIEVEEPAFELTVVGHRADLRYLSVEEVISVHYQLVGDFCKHSDPIEPAGVRELSLLESAVFRPQTSFGVTNKYPTIEMAGAAVAHSLIHNHPFHNGNKRTALVSLLVFLDSNNFMLACNEDELFRLVLQTAQHTAARGPRH